MQTSSINRLHHLDAARAIALLLGVVFHASLSFMPFFIGWAVMDINTSNAVTAFVMVSHSFRLEVFFLIAGFFAHMSFQRQGNTRFITSRLFRIALPFALFWFLLKPLIDAGWIMGTNSYNGELRIWASLSMAYSNFSTLPHGIFVGSHLWFLYYLLLTTSSVILIRSALGLKKDLLQKTGERFDSLINRLMSNKLSIVIVTIPTVICLWFMDRWGVDTPDRSLVPDVPVFALYSLFFCLGWLLHRVPERFVEWTRLSWVKGALMILSIVMSLMLSPFESQYGHPLYTWLKLGFIISYAFMMWTLVLFLIGLCGRLFSKPNALVRYMADASYWMYLIHLPIVVFLQVLLADITLPWLSKLCLVVFGTVSISLLSYDAFVRSTWLGTLLNGKPKSRVLLPVTGNRRLAHEAP